jgi:hypothetical protein
VIDVNWTTPKRTRRGCRTKPARPTGFCRRPRWGSCPPANERLGRASMVRDRLQFALLVDPAEQPASSLARRSNTKTDPKVKWRRAFERAGVEFHFFLCDRRPRRRFEWRQSGLPAQSSGLNPLNGSSTQIRVAGRGCRVFHRRPNHQLHRRRSSKRSLGEPGAFPASPGHKTCAYRRACNDDSAN